MTKYRIKMNGKVYEMEVELVDGTTPAPATAVAPAATRDLPADMHRQPLVATRPAPAKPAAAGAILSPLQGTIIKVCAANGDAVTAGQTILILEAMKMQNEITAPKAGTLADLAVTEGQHVASGEPLFSIG